MRAVGRLSGGVFAGISRLRRAKSAHPYGAVYEATLEVRGGAHVPGEATLLATPAEHRAIVPRC